MTVKQEGGTAGSQCFICGEFLPGGVVHTHATSPNPPLLPSGGFGVPLWGGSWWCEVCARLVTSEEIHPLHPFPGMATTTGYWCPRCQCLSMSREAHACPASYENGISESQGENMEADQDSCNAAPREKTLDELIADRQSKETEIANEKSLLKHYEERASAKQNRVSGLQIDVQAIQAEIEQRLGFNCAVKFT